MQSCFAVHLEEVRWHVKLNWPAAHPTRPWVEGEISSLAQRAMARNVSPFFLLDLMPTYAKGH